MIPQRLMATKTTLKSVFTFFQSLSWFFHLSCFVKCKRTLFELNSYQPHSSSERERKFCHWLFTSSTKRQHVSKLSGGGGGLLADKSLSSGCIREINCAIHWIALSTFRTTGPRSWLRWRSTQLMLIEAKVRRVSSAYIKVYEADSGKTIWEVVNTNKKVKQ